MFLEELPSAFTEMLQATEYVTCTYAALCSQDISYPTDTNLLSDAKEKTEELTDFYIHHCWTKRSPERTGDSQEAVFEKCKKEGEI